MEDKVEITPAILREAGFKESHFPVTTFKYSCQTDKYTDVYIEITYNKRALAYSIDVREYINNRIEDRCRFSGLSITSEINDVLSLFRYSDKLPKLPTDSQ